MLNMLKVKSNVLFLVQIWNNFEDYKRIYRNSTSNHFIRAYNAMGVFVDCCYFRQCIRAIREIEGDHLIYGVIGYHVTLSDGHMIANHPI